MDYGKIPAVESGLASQLMKPEPGAAAAGGAFGQSNRRSDVWRAGSRGVFGSSGGPVFTK